MKEKIKATAISLFNTQGFSVVSMKQIADALGISAGNLQYHYKNKEALIEEIYSEMYDETLYFILPKNSYVTLFHFEEMMLKFHNLQQRYAFFFKEIVHITSVYPSISKQYEAISFARLKDARKLIGYYIESFRMVPESETVNYNQVVYNIWMTSTFWQSQNQILKTKNDKINNFQPIEILWRILLPYLTEQGLAEYKQLKKFVKPPKN